MIVNSQYNSNNSSFTFSDGNYELIERPAYTTLLGLPDRYVYTMKQTANNVFIWSDNKGDRISYISPQGVVSINSTNGNTSHTWRDVAETQTSSGSNFAFLSDSTIYCYRAESQLDLYSAKIDDMLSATGISAKVIAISDETDAFNVCFVTSTHAKTGTINSNHQFVQHGNLSIDNIGGNVFCAAGNNKFVVAIGRARETSGYESIQIITFMGYTTTETPRSYSLDDSDNVFNVYSLYFDHYAQQFVISYGENNGTHYLATSKDGLTWKKKSINYAFDERKYNVAFDKTYYYVLNKDHDYISQYNKNLNMTTSTSLPDYGQSGPYCQ